MKAHQEVHSVSKMCQVLIVGRSDYYAWRKRTPSARAQTNQVLTEEIRRVYLKSRRTYGSPRVHAALLREGIVCRRNRVARLMRGGGLVDITYIDTTEGWLYLAPVLDLFGRKIVGWAMADHMESSLVESALEMAFTQCQPDADLLHHSDQGSQYTGNDYLALLK